MLAQLDDTPTSIDPRLEFAVPAGVEAVDLVVRNNLGGGPENFYRLVVTSAEMPVREVTAKLNTDVVNLLR